MMPSSPEQFKDRPFYVPSPLGERLILPPKYIDELKSAPKELVDFAGAFFNVRDVSLVKRHLADPRAT